jgi:hypothetical protein
MVMTNSGPIWRTLTLLARFDMAAGIVIALVLLVMLAGR